MEINTDINNTNNLEECLNCQQALEGNEEFCPACGQKTTASVLSLKDILSNFLSNTLYLDSKMWKSYGKLLIPARTTKRFVEGQRKKYIHPFRLFFISAILFFSLVNILTSKIIDENTDTKVNLTDQIYTEIQTYDRRTKLLDSIEIKDTSVLSYINFVGKIKPDYGKDSVLLDTIFPFTSTITIGEGGSSRNTVNRRNDDKIISQVSNRDLFELSAEEIFEKYEITGWWDKFNFRQTLRMSKSPIAGVKFVLNNFIWGVFIIVGACAWILRLLFFRRRKSYVEALLLLFEIHTIAFLLMTIGILSEYFMGSSNLNKSMGISSLISLIYFFVMLKRYYKENVFWTLLKTLLFAFSYLIMFLIFMSLTALISMAFF